MSNSTDRVIAGSLAGSIELATIWPIENIKTQLQLYPDRSKAPFQGIISCARYNIQTEGIISLYRGLVPLLVSNFPKAGVRFASQQHYRDWCGNSNLGVLASGSLAGITEATLVTTPAETIKTRIINQRQNLLAGLRNIYRTDGFSGYYRGLAPTALKAATNQGSRFLVYHNYRKIVETKREYTRPDAFLGGMLAGGISVLCNNPVDVVKTLSQASDQRQTLFQTVRDAHRKYGLSFLTAGIGARLARVVPGQGVLFFSYETIMEKLQETRTEQTP